MTYEQMRERAAEICREQMRKDRETEADPALRGVAILTAKELEKAIRAIPIPPTPPDPSAEALKLAEEALKRSHIYLRENGALHLKTFRSENPEDALTFDMVTTALAAIRKITGGA